MNAQMREFKLPSSLPLILSLFLHVTRLSLSASFHSSRRGERFVSFAMNEMLMLMCILYRWPLSASVHFGSPVCSLVRLVSTLLQGDAVNNLCECLSQRSHTPRQVINGRIRANASGLGTSRAAEGHRRHCRDARFPRIGRKERKPRHQSQTCSNPL